MRTITFAILLLSSSLVHQTLAANALEQSVNTIAGLNPQAIMRMADQPYSDTNYKNLTRAVGIMLNMFQVITPPYIANQFKSHEGSLISLSNLINVLNTTIGVVNKTLKSEIDYHEAQDTEEFKKVWAALGNTGCCSDIASISLRLAKAETSIQNNYALTLTNFQTLNRNLALANLTLNGAISNLRIQISQLTVKYDGLIRNLGIRLENEELDEQKLFGYYNTSLAGINKEVSNISDYLVTEEKAEDLRMDKNEADIINNYNSLKNMISALGGTGGTGADLTGIYTDIDALNAKVNNISSYLVDEDKRENKTFDDISANFTSVDTYVKNISNYLITEEVAETAAFLAINNKISAGDTYAKNISEYLITEEAAENLKFAEIATKFDAVDTYAKNISEYLITEEAAETAAFKAINDKIAAADTYAKNISNYLITEQAKEDTTFSELWSNITAINKTATNLSQYLINEQAAEDLLFKYIFDNLTYVNTTIKNLNTVGGYKLYYFEFNGFAVDSGPVTKIVDGYTIVSDKTTNNIKYHTYTVTFPTNIFTQVPIISLSIKSAKALSGNQVTYVVYSYNPSLTGVTIYVMSGTSNIDISEYNVQVILYGK